jgi:heat shock protein HtpX
MQGKFYNNVKTVFLLGSLTALVLLCGHLIGGRQGVTIALIMAGVMNFVAYFFSDKLALMSMSAHEVGPEHPLHRIVAGLVQRANMPMPRVYVSPQAAPNAFATGRNPRKAAVCATEGLLRMLDSNEVAGVMAHELAHVKHRDILIASVAATIAGAISYLGYMLYFPGAMSSDDDDGGSPLGALGALLVLILGPIAAMLIQMAISRSREFNADKAGAEICGNPMYLATALEKIHAAAHQIPLQVNPAFNALLIAEPLNAVPGAVRSLGNLFATHPPLEARLLNLIGRERSGMFAY